MYIPRVAEQAVLRYLKSFPVLGLTGPRQSGKSTLLRHLLPKYSYVSFDDPKNILFFEEDPDGFLNKFPEGVIYDEVQQVPQIFNYLKIRVDNDRLHYGNYILTGSSQFEFMQKITESLAGRIGLMSLLPFQYYEMPKALVTESIYKGGYPELVTRNYHESELWYAGYIQTYLNKDVRILTNIGDMRDFRRFLQLLAGNIAQPLDMSLYARDLGISVPTIKRWISILEASYILFLIPPFYENHGKRIVKRPKMYFLDTGLVSYFTGIKTYEQFNAGPLSGALFENYIVSEIFKKELHSATHSELYYLRTQDKAEIDLIIDRKSTKDFIEIKKSATFNPKMTKTLTSYSNTTDNRIILYQGEPYEHKGIKAMPYWDYLMNTAI